jgi:hypothetical protein
MMLIQNALKLRKDGLSPRSQGHFDYQALGVEGVMSYLVYRNQSDLFRSLHFLKHMLAGLLPPWPKAFNP